MEELDSWTSVYNGIEARMTRSTVFLLLKTLQIGVPTVKEVSSSDCDYDHGSDSAYWHTAMVNMSCKIGKMFGRQECHTSSLWVLLWNQQFYRCVRCCCRCINGITEMGDYCVTIICLFMRGLHFVVI